MIILIICVIIKIIINKNRKPYLFWYWEGSEKNYINLCFNTVKKNCSKSFNIIKLNNITIHEWLPELKKYEKYFAKLIIAQKVDIYRIMLLEKYGGLYIDADILVLKNPIEIIKKLDDYDFVGFGCTGIKCKYGYGRPSNAIMASRPHTRLMKNILNEQLNEIKHKDAFEYFDLGKYIIWKYIGKYYHYENKYDGTRDKYGNWITNTEIFSNKEIEYEDIDNMLFLEMYNSNASDKLNNMTYNELINGKTNFANFYKLAMK
jgi:mannosyltransferase OCH1-like enzyme